MKIAWNNEQDSTIGEVIVREVKNGKFLKEAFGIAAEELNILFETKRNAGSVSTRWYAEVAKDFGSQIENINTSGKSSWTPLEDETLAYTLITFFKNNKTQKAAFEYVSEKLGRTYAAAQARWVDVLIKGHYGDLYKRLKAGEEVDFTPSNEGAVTIVKQETEVKTEEQPKVVQAIDTQPVNQMLGQLNSYLNSIENEKVALGLENQELRQEIIQLQGKTLDYEELKANVEALQIQLTQRTQELIKLEGDYQNLENDNKAYLRLVDRARKLQLEEESGPIERSNAKFKMDQNGNLERVY